VGRRFCCVSRYRYGRSGAIAQLSLVSARCAVSLHLGICSALAETLELGLDGWTFRQATSPNMALSLLAYRAAGHNVEQIPRRPACTDGCSAGRRSRRQELSSQELSKQRTRAPHQQTLRRRTSAAPVLLNTLLVRQTGVRVYCEGASRSGRPV
jgi:hypothetical protein